ncbi:MAG: hypothetical protein RJA57_602 [Bacteroidota bacterium]|jgi:CHAT domain-containing protein
MVTCYLFLLVPQLRAQDMTGYDSLVYRAYEEQFASLLSVRGMEPFEINKVLTAYRQKGVNSDADLANWLGLTYPSDRGIGFLFYFFRNDSLRRVFIRPGKVMETLWVPVKKDSLLQLTVDLNQVLGLYAGTGNRLPRVRGAIVKPPPASKGMTYDRLVMRLTKLLLPSSFDTSYRHLIIVPALNIGTLPFALLRPYPDGRLLADHCSVTVVPGLIDLVGMRIGALRTAAGWGGFGATSYAQIDPARKLDSLRFTLAYPLFICNPRYPLNTRYDFPDLPGAKKEIGAALPFATSYKLFEGAEARKDSIWRYIGRTNLLWFATHGMADTVDAKKGFLVLSGDDPFLTVKDIMDRRNQYRSYPEMVILSACQTGLGRAMEAGIAGLARSFILSGSKHVIMSLWNVDDEATAFLMGRFLYHLQQPSAHLPAEPLRKAMQDTRRKFPRPAQWASFTLFGIDY